MPHSLHTLAYFSRNAVRETGGNLEAELTAILASARRNNPTLSLTGALIFSNDCFAQVLEGPLSSIEGVFESIECDARHRDVTVLHFKPIEARSFPNWSMAFAKVPQTESLRLNIDGVLADPAGIDGQASGLDIIAILQGLLARHAAASNLELRQVA